MRARCLHNDLAALQADSAFAEAIATVYPRRDEAFDLKVGAEYVVFAIADRFGVDWYYVFDDPKEAYPAGSPRRCSQS